MRRYRVRQYYRMVRYYNVVIIITFVIKIGDPYLR